jgi:CHAD domain-containing protein
MARKTESQFPLLDYVDQLVEDLRGNVTKALKDWDAEGIHRARVATRRLKAALDLLRPVISDEQRKPFATVLKKLRRRLGPMRDLDVMIGHLKDLRESPAHAEAVKWLEEHLRLDRERVREEAADKGSHSRVLSRLGTWWGLREEVLEAKEAADSLLAESLHLQLDSFAEQADRLAAAEESRNGDERQDPHAVRIAGKAFRYTLEMAAVQGHKLPAAVMSSFKRMQEALGLWHDYVVLTERAMQVSLEDLLPHHDAPMQARVLDLARTLLKRSQQHMGQFSRLWAQRGGEVADAVRSGFPLTRSLSAPQTDQHPPRSEETASPAAPPPGAVSTAQA